MAADEARPLSHDARPLVWTEADRERALQGLRKDYGEGWIKKHWHLLEEQDTGWAVKHKVHRCDPDCAGLSPAGLGGKGVGAVAAPGQGDGERRRALASRKGRGGNAEGGGGVSTPSTPAPTPV
jgi:hypothetical protein